MQLEQEKDLEGLELADGLGALLVDGLDHVEGDALGCAGLDQSGGF